MSFEHKPLQRKFIQNIPPQIKPLLETMKNSKAEGGVKNKSFPGTLKKREIFIADLKTQMKTRG